MADVAFAMSTHDLAIEHFLDRSTGEVTVLIEGDDSEEGDALREAIEQAPDRFIPIPRSEAREDYARMERFVDELDDPAAVDQLRDALSGKGAFSRFRSAVERSSLRDKWFAFEGRDRARLAREWLASVDVPVDETAQAPSAPQPSRTATVTPLRIAHLLLLGAPDGKTEIIGGRVRRWVPATSEGDARRAFRELARDLHESHGIAWRNRFIEGRSDVTVGDVTLTLERNGVSADVVVPPDILARFCER